jgi:hypothetical protein
VTSEQQLVANPDLYFAQRQKLVNALFRLWSTVITDHQPTEDNFAGWLDTFGAEITAKAIRRTADKVRTQKRQRMPLDGPDMERYCTGTAKHLGREAGFIPAFRAK